MTKKTGHSYRQTIHRMHWILLLASHTLAEPDLSHWGGTPTLHPLPCLPILCVPLGEPRGCGQILRSRIRLSSTSSLDFFYKDWIRDGENFKIVKNKVEPRENVKVPPEHQHPIPPLSFPISVIPSMDLHNWNSSSFPVKSAGTRL